MTVYNTAKIDLSALEHNAKIVKSLAPNSQILAMVKANAYGHGLIPVAKTLATEVNALGVARLEEALSLKKENIKTPIVVANGFFSKEELSIIADNEFIAVIHSPHQMDLVEHATLKKPLSVWLKINTGMNRLGLPWQIFAEYYDQAKKLNNIAPNFVLMTHFACEEEQHHPLNQQQYQRFAEATKLLPETKSLANSAAILTDPTMHANWVRPGIMLYGASPIPNTCGKDFDLRPVMTLTSKIIAIQQVKKSEAIGYGATFTCPEDMKIGVVAMGYGDGFPRHIQNGAPVLVNDEQAYVAGRLSMDMMTIDLQRCPRAKVGDDVLLWGPELPSEVVSAHADTISYELFCHLSHDPSRVRFVYK